MYQPTIGLPLTLVRVLLSFQYNAFNPGQAPNYLAENLILYNTGHSEDRRRLHSASDVTRLVVPCSYKKAGDNLFFNAAHNLWNQLRCNVREAMSTLVFKRSLITFSFPTECNV